MSPPIRDGSGSSIGSIRLGDGSEISEVRTGAGEVLFSGSAIPDSVTNRFKMDEGSGTNFADSIGSISASFPAGTWESDTKFTGGTAPNHDGSDDYWQTDNTIAINGSEGSVLSWFDVDSADNFARLMSTTNDPSTIATDGWGLMFDDTSRSTIIVRHHSGGSGSNAYSVTGPDFTTGDLFVALTFNGDSSTFRIYDESGLQASNSGSAPRGQTGNEYLTGMASDGGYVAGNQDDCFISTTTEMTQSDIETVLEQTLR